MPPEACLQIPQVDRYVFKLLINKPHHAPMKALRLNAKVRKKHIHAKIYSILTQLQRHYTSYHQTLPKVFIEWNHWQRTLHFEVGCRPPAVLTVLLSCCKNVLQFGAIEHQISTADFNISSCRRRSHIRYVFGKYWQSPISKLRPTTNILFWLQYVC